MLTHRGDTILGNIPSDWEAVPLRRLLAYHKGGDWGEDDGSVELKVLRSTNFTMDGHLDFSDVAIRYLTASSAEKLQLKKGDLLLERSGGGPTQPVGRIGFIRQDLPGHACSNFVQLLRPDADEINPEYLGWVLYAVNRSGVIERLQHQTTQMRNLDYRDYIRTLVPTPPRPEQDAIVYAVHTVDDAIARTKDEIEATRRLKKALMQQLFTRGVPGRHTRFKQTKIGEVPEAWDVLPVGSLLERMDSGKSPMCEDRPAVADEWGVLKVSAVSWDSFLPEENKLLPYTIEPLPEHKVEMGNLIMSRANTTDLIGAVQRVRRLTANLLLSDKTWRLVPKDEVNSEWLLHALKQSRVRHTIEARATGTSDSMKNMSKRDLRRILIGVPKPDEQSEIEQLFNSIRNAEVALVETLQAYVKLETSLLQNLLTGKVRVKAEVSA